MKTNTALFWALTICLGLCACASERPAMIWERGDRQQITANPQLQRQFEMDDTYCRGEVAKALTGTARGEALEDQVYQGCMAGRGYLEKK